MTIYEKVVRTLDRVDNIEDVKSILNSINDNQLKNKNHVMDIFSEYADMLDNPKILIVAGWYGLLGHMIHERYGFDVTVTDMDPKCREYGKRLFPDVKHQTVRMSDINPEDYDVIFCTACEHISDEELNEFISKKKSSTIMFLQSNNYHGIDGHINCKNSLVDFIDNVNLEIKQSDTLSLNKYDRYTVVGI